VPPSRRGGRSRHLWRRSRAGTVAADARRTRPARGRAQRAERQGEVVGRDADGVEVTRDEVVARGEPLTDKAKRAFEDTAGPVDWSAEDES
jgi:hypothetical protein